MRCLAISESLVYIRKNPSGDNIELETGRGKGGAVLPKLMKDLYEKGYHSYIDKWYTSEKLSDHFEQNGAAACGATRLNHK